MTLKIAIVGAGAAGLASAWLLQDAHDVVLFEHDKRPGGHVYTVDIEEGGRSFPVELGAEFFFDQGYPALLALLERLGLNPVKDALSVSLRMTDPSAILVIPPKNLSALRTCAAPRALRELYWMGRVAAAGEVLVRRGDWSVSVAALMERARVPRDVSERLLVPLIASSWGVTIEQALEMAAELGVRWRSSQESLYATIFWLHQKRLFRHLG